MSLNNAIRTDQINRKGQNLYAWFGRYNIIIDITEVKSYTIIYICLDNSMVSKATEKNDVNLNNAYQMSTMKSKSLYEKNNAKRLNSSGSPKFIKKYSEFNILCVSYLATK